MRSARPMFILAAVLSIALMLSGCERRAELGTREEPVDTDARQVDVALGEWYVRLDPDTVEPGSVQFSIRNEGKALHAFEIENGDVEERSENLRPGESDTMTVDLPAGEYKAYCPIGNHAERGMHTTLTVREE